MTLVVPGPRVTISDVPNCGIVRAYDIRELHEANWQPVPWLAAYDYSSAHPARQVACNRVLVVPGQLADVRCRDWWLMTHGENPPDAKEREEQLREVFRQVNSTHAIPPQAMPGGIWVISARAHCGAGHSQLGNPPYDQLCQHEVTRFGICGKAPIDPDEHAPGCDDWINERLELQAWMARLLLGHTELFSVAILDNVTYNQSGATGVRIAVAW